MQTNCHGRRAPRCWPLLTRYQDPEARRLIFRAVDVQARIYLLNLSERLYDAGNYQGSMILFHAERYLADREAYECNHFIPAWTSC